jgi:hypothetical protein
MEIEQRVQVEILGAPRPYSYAWYFDPLDGGQSLSIGDKVELPPNQVQKEGSSGTVCDLGTPYRGELKRIVRIIKRAYELPPRVHGHELHETGPDELEFRRPAADDIWGGFGEGDYK